MRTNVAQLIEEAVQECIDYGTGACSNRINGKFIFVGADWADSETEIEIVLIEDGVIKFSWTEEMIV